MKEMIGTAMTVVGVRTNGGEWEAQAEVTVATKEPKYGLVSGAAMAKTFEFDQFRFVAPADGLRRLAKLLNEHADELDRITAESKRDSGSG